MQIKFRMNPLKQFYAIKLTIKLGRSGSVMWQAITSKVVASACVS
jgi:hypothetical protein